MFKYIVLFVLAVIFVPPVRQFVFWLLIGRKLAEQQKKANDFIKSQQRPEGDIKVTNSSKKPDSNGEGEYIDFQEIK